MCAYFWWWNSSRRRWVYTIHSIVISVCQSDFSIIQRRRKANHMISIRIQFQMWRSVLPYQFNTVNTIKPVNHINTNIFAVVYCYKCIIGQHMLFRHHIVWEMCMYIVFFFSIYIDEIALQKMKTNTTAHSPFVTAIFISFFLLSFVLYYVFFFLSKDEDISVVFGAKSLKNYTGQFFSNVSIHKKDYDR